MKYLKVYENIFQDGDLIEYNRAYFKKIWGNILNTEVNGKNLKVFYDRLLREIYGPRGLYVEGNYEYMPGVYNTGLPLDSPRSHVNFLNTNYTIFRFFINEINEYIYKGKYKNYEQFNFYEENLHDNLEKFFNFLTEYKDDIFRDDSDILLTLIKIVFNTKKKGEVAENFTMDKLSKFKGITDIVKSKDWGFKEDMLMGIDIKFTYNNRIKKIQVKSFESIKLEDDNYIIRGVSNPKKYDKIDLFAFYNHENSDFHMFDNKNVKINGDNVIVNKIYKRNI